MTSASSGHDAALARDTRVIVLVGTAHGLSHFFHLILAPLFPWIKEAFALSYAELGLLMTVFFVVSGIGQALAGFVVDRIGAFPVLVFGVGCLLLAGLGLAASPTYATLLAFSGLAGLGNSVFHPADFTLMNRRVSAQRLAYAFSAHGVLGTIGWAVAPAFLAGIAALAGWRVAVLGGAAVAGVILVALLMNRAVLGGGEVAGSAAAQSRAVAGGSLFGFLALPGVWMCFAFFFITAMALGAIQSFAPAAIHDLYAIPIALAMVGITVYMLASAGGMILGGILATRTAQHDRLLGGAFALSGVLSLVIASQAVSAWSILPLLASIGFLVGIAGPSRDLLVRSAAPRGATGRVYGIVYSGIDAGVSFAPLMFGALMDAHRPGAVFVVMGALQVGALITALSMGGMTARQRAQQAA